jgi:hypothetical protein
MLERADTRSILPATREARRTRLLAVDPPRAEPGQVKSEPDASLAAVLLSDCVAPAALSSKLIGSTVEAVACALVGRAVAGVVSTKVAILAEGVVKAMFMSKIKSVVPALVLVGALISGALVVGAGGPGPVLGPSAELGRGRLHQGFLKCGHGRVPDLNKVSRGLLADLEPVAV